MSREQGAHAGAHAALGPLRRPLGPRDTGTADSDRQARPTGRGVSAPAALGTGGPRKLAHSSVLGGAGEPCTPVAVAPGAEAGPRQRPCPEADAQGSWAPGRVSLCQQWAAKKGVTQGKTTLSLPTAPSLGDMSPFKYISLSYHFQQSGVNRTFTSNFVVSDFLTCSAAESVSGDLCCNLGIH